MFTNADVTLYLYHKSGKEISYERVPIPDVYWEDVRQSTFLKTGQRDAASVFSGHPLKASQSRFVFTQGKDLAVKGIVEDENRLCCAVRKPCQSHWQR